MFKKMKRGTKVGVIAGLVLLIVVVTKLFFDGCHLLKANLEHRRLEAARQAEIQRLAEEDARLLRDQVHATRTTIDEALSTVVLSSENVDDWVGKYKDAWGTDIRIVRVKGTWKGFAVESAGPDKRFGTRDDLVKEKTNFSTLGMFRGSSREEVKPETRSDKKSWWPL